MSIKKDILFRVGFVYFGFLLLGMIIIARIVHIQFVQGSKYRDKSKAISLKHFTIDPNRGDILATDGRLLATSMPNYEIRMDMQAKGLDKDMFYEEVDSLALCLANLTNDRPKSMYKNDLIQAFKKGERFHLVRRKVNYNELQAIKKFPLFRLGKNKSGMMAMQENIRFQPHQSLACRTIGYISKSEDGNVVGIEGGYDKFLRGDTGVRLMQRLSGNVWMPVSDYNEVDPKDGSDVVSTLDVNMQDVAESALRKQLEAQNAHHGCAILMEVKTGEIKAITNLERDESGHYREIFNYAIGEAAEPGSTFKLASMIAVLEDGYVQLSDMIDTGDGVATYYGQKMKDSGEKGHGRISVKKVFELSSNVGVSAIITKYYRGREKQFVDRLYGLKINLPLNLDIKGEGIPEIKYPGDKHWSGLSLPFMSIGYEVKLAPIHTLTLYNAIANDGKMVKPHFVKAIMYHGKTVKTFGTEVIQSSICSKSTLAKVKEMLEGVVTEGTAMNLRNSTYSIAGKTGTAQIANAKFGYKSILGIRHQASFVGYFPAKNPEYTCIVVINSPSNGVIYGASVAGPVFKEIADKVYASSLSIQPVLRVGKPVDMPLVKTGFRKDLDKVFDGMDMKFNDDKAQSNWVVAAENNKEIEYSNRFMPKNVVPNVMDMGLCDAMFLLENAGLKVTVHGRGKVTSQSIAPGSKIRPGDTVVLEMS
jgi:cell division protein FtsI (penicillin-binding protein 3)